MGDETLAHVLAGAPLSTELDPSSATLRFHWTDTHGFNVVDNALLASLDAWCRRYGVHRCQGWCGTSPAAQKWEAGDTIEIRIVDAGPATCPDTDPQTTTAGDTVEEYGPLCVCSLPCPGVK